MDNTTQYNPFEWKCDPEQIENCYDLAVSKLMAMYSEYRLLSSDMFGIDIYNDIDGSVVAQYSTGITSNGDLAIQNIDTKEVCTLCAA